LLHWENLNFNLIKYFSGLAAQLINSCFEKQKVVLGMIEITDTTINDITYMGQCAENIKAAIEKIVNEYKFDKSKIIGYF
jgi:hypothetical protein